ncbi:MAG TPA: response regulator transcription factor [Acidimicrobiales bacterium]|jgi:DNA-binding NarL/FixJ family response regulator|nr:response regulator transcription factor [Acidimicrobiales bacterium]
MASRLAVFVFGDDPISQAGVAAQLRGRPEVLVVDEEHRADVAVVVAETLTGDVTQTIRRLKRSAVKPVVLVITNVDDRCLLEALELGTAGLLRRREATPEALAVALANATRGEGTLAPDLLGSLMRQVGRLQREVLAPRGVDPTGFSDREVKVLRLLAEGLDTDEIAERLCYSQRTIKNVIHQVTTRMCLRNRSHAVAYAMKFGVI